VQLEELALIRLDIKELPESFKNLINLFILDLSMNKLNMANEPDKLKQLKSLEKLFLIRNKVEEGDIEQLKKANPKLEVFF